MGYFRNVALRREHLSNLFGGFLDAWVSIRQ